MKVAIAWYGAEGQSSYRYYTAKGDDVTIVTPKIGEEFPLPQGAQSITGEDALAHLKGFDLVLRSSGVRPDALVTDGMIWSSTNEFFAQCPAPIIGVTGTKGKGTTASFIASILRAAGKTVHLVGNIGVPPLDVLSVIQSTDIVVFELSSFQLWDLTKSPHVAVVLLIEPDHLDVHRDMEEYVAAKANIVRYQTPDDIVFCHPLNKASNAVARQSPGTVRHYADSGEGEVYIRDGAFWRDDERICTTDAVTLQGAFNLENACAAISAALQYTDDVAAVEQGLRDFTGLPHRLKLVRAVDGVDYYDDNYSSQYAATIAAIASFRDRPVILIAGGYDRGIDYRPLAEAIVQYRVKHVLLIGETAGTIATELSALGYTAFRQLTDVTMQEIVAAARAHAQPGDVVVMSPGCASFDMFANFTDRGNQFIEVVEAL